MLTLIRYMTWEHLLLLVAYKTQLRYVIHLVSHLTLMSQGRFIFMDGDKSVTDLNRLYAYGM